MVVRNVFRFGTDMGSVVEIWLDHRFAVKGLLGASGHKINGSGCEAKFGGGHRGGGE